MQVEATFFFEVDDVKTIEDFATSTMIVLPYFADNVQHRVKFREGPRRAWKYWTPLSGSLPNLPWLKK